LAKLEATAKLLPPYAPKDHWFETLWQKLRKPTWKEVQKTKLRIVTFNYDRCLEGYLAKLASNHYGISEKVASRWLKQELIAHVHGTLGQYEYGKMIWLRPKRVLEGITGLGNSISSIVVISEARPRTKEFIRARKWISHAKRLGFLGFGFHNENMKRLGIEPGAESLAHVTYLTHTSKGLSRYDRGRIYISYFRPHDLHDSHKATSISQLVREFVYAY